MRLFLDSGNILSQVMRMKVQGKKYRRLVWGAFLLSTVASVMLVALPLILATSQVAALSDTTPPTVSITFPGNGAWVNGIQTVSVVAIDSVGISKVVLYVDGVLKSTDTSSPYSFSLNTGVYADGSTHTIRADAYDSSNNKASKQISVKVDNKAPTVYTTSPFNGATISGSLTWSAVASDNMGVKFVYFFVDGGLYSSSLTFPYVQTLSTSGYSNGAHKFMAIAYDIAMNEARHEITVNINNPDITSPTVTITNPANGAVVSGTTNIDVRSFDVNSVTRVEYYADGALVGSDTTLTHPDSFYYASISWNTASVPNGSHTIMAKGFDLYNNVGTRSITVTVSNAAASDTTPPVVTPPPNQTAEATSSLGAAVSYPPATALDNVDGALATTCAPTSGSTFALGTTTVSCSATDSSSNIGKASFTVTVKDTKAPVAQVTNPSNAETIKGMITTSVSATDDGSGISKVELYVDNALKSTASSAPYSFSLDTTPYLDGTHKLGAKAYDKVSNTAYQEISVNVLNQPAVDTIPPAITSVSVGAWVSGIITIPVSATDNVGISKVELYVDGMLKGTDTSSPYSFVLDTKVYADGSTHTLSAIAYDTSNNKATLSKSITVDNTPPSVSIMSPTNGGTVTGVISVSVSASDANSGIYLVFIYVDGKWIATDLAAPYVVSLDTTAYASGTHVIKAVALDKAYNYSTIEISVTKASR